MRVLLNFQKKLDSSQQKKKLIFERKNIYVYMYKIHRGIEGWIFLL